MQGAWLFGIVALVLVGMGGYALGTLLERRRADAAARLARLQAQREAELRDDWAWHCDASHQLQRLLPPAGSGDADVAALPAPGTALAQVFDAGGSGDGLQARLQARLPFSGLRVRRADGSAWLLRAAPRLDAEGRFDGFDGRARPLAASDAQRADQAALRVLLASLDHPALVATGDGPADGWRLRHANAAAVKTLDARVGQTLHGLWPQLPAALHEAASRGDESADHDGWRLRRVTFGDGGAGLLLQKSAAPTTADDAGAGSEGESFSFTLSHDLRAPIRVVEGFTRIVKEDYGGALDRVGNDHLDRVLGAAARMNQMIDALLTLARLSQQPLALQPVNLSQIATWVVDELRRAAPERAAHVEIEPDLQARGDPTLLRLVLENLLGNAWKYSANTKKAHIVFGSELHDGRRAFVVRDNGAGFDMRSAERLFSLFQRLHSAKDFPGTGVGLASVKRIVRRHGGDIWADAEPGRGAAFHFTLRD